MRPGTLTSSCCPPRCSPDLSWPPSGDLTAAARREIELPAPPGCPRRQAPPQGRYAARIHSALVQNGCPARRTGRACQSGGVPGGGRAVAAAQVNNAVELLIQRCMRAKGLVYYPLILTAAQELNGIGLAGVPQAPIGPAAREANGYGFYSRAVQAAANPGQAGPSREQKYANSAPHSYLLALLGPENEG